MYDGLLRRMCAEKGRHVCMCMEGEGVTVKIQWMNTC